MPQDRTIEEMGSKKVSDLIGPDVKVKVTGTPEAPVGAVTGTFHFVKEWKAFNSTNPAEQKGNYFPFTLDSKWKGQEITVTGTDGKTKKAEDTEWVLRLSKGKESTFTFKQADTQIIKLTFTGATLETENG